MSKFSRMSHSDPEVPQSPHKYLKVLKSTSKYLELPVSTQKYLEVPKSTQKYFRSTKNKLWTSKSESCWLYVPFRKHMTSTEKPREGQGQVLEMLTHLQIVW